MNTNTNLYVSIDFGTCHTVISYIDNVDFKINHILDNITGDVLIPTTIYFDIQDEKMVHELEYNKDFFIGNDANEMYNQKKESLYFYQFKRFLGITSKSSENHINFVKKFDQEFVTDEDLIYFYLKTQKEEKNIKIKISIIELIKLFFIGLGVLIRDRLNISPEIEINVAITIPAYFHDLQRTQLKRAVEDAKYNNNGFKIFKIFNEPTAASIYYIKNYYKECDSNKKFIIYDLGGGTIDTTVVEYHYEDNTCEILDISGNSSLGGIDIDNLLINNIYTKYNIDTKNNKIKNKIRKCAEEIKIKLSFNTTHSVVLEDVPIIKNGEVYIKENLKIEYTRHFFNNLINELIEEMIKSIIEMNKKYETNNIIFIGGPTQIPLLQNKVYSILGINDNILISNSGNIINNTSNTLLYKTIVADGACLMYNLISIKNDIILLDIIPMNIGISDDDNKMIIMINKNNKIPLSCENIFTTSHDCQRTIDINIYEGLDNDCSKNNFIGSYKIVGIPPLPKGKILIKLIFHISLNGILNISINGLKNPYDDEIQKLDYKLCEKIKLISNYMAKDILKKLLITKITK